MAIKPLEPAIYALLAANSGVTTLVSTRIYRMILPQNATLPAITFDLIGADVESAMGADHSLVAKTLQVDSWATSHATARSVMDAARAALQRYHGTQSTTVIQTILWTNEYSLYEKDTKYFHLINDFRVFYTEV